MIFGSRLASFISRKFSPMKAKCCAVDIAPAHKVVDIEKQKSISPSSIADENSVTIDSRVEGVVATTVLPYDHVVTLRPEERQFHCQIRIPASDVKYSMVLTVTNSWEQDLKIIPNWDRIGGELLLRKMFELEPECIEMFGFPSDTKYDDPALSNNDKFIKKGIALIIAVDVALTFLGPDLEPLEAQLVELGGRHVARLCKPKHWPMVGVALFHTLEVALGEKFTAELQRCWVILYNFLGYHMIQGLIAKGGPTWDDKPALSNSSTSIASAAVKENHHGQSSSDITAKAKTTTTKTTDAVVTTLPHANVVLRPEEMKFHCQVRIPASDVKYSMVLTVTNSWEHDLKCIPCWDKIGGELLLRKMFELEPECIEMFGFPLDTKYDDPALSQNDKFIKKGIALIIAVDVALTFLGPDLEPLEAQLHELGGRHVARLCKPKHWPMVGVALFHTLEVALGNKFTKELQDCWVILYNFLGYHMIHGLIANGGPTWDE